MLLFTFDDSKRWPGSATNGGGLTQGDPTVLTWGFALNGVTNIPGLNGESSGDNRLIHFLDTNIGAGPGGADLTQRPWFPIFDSAFTRYSQLSGLHFVYEPADDGASFNATPGSNPGILGVRADIRLGGHKVDGQGGDADKILAYAQFPNLGDIVIDTDNVTTLTNSSGNFFALRNVLMHEIGHSLGIDHVKSGDGDFLMEPNLQTTFDGPQLDDILAIHRGYGDGLEKGIGNNTSQTAHDLGFLGKGAIIKRGLLGDTKAVAPAEKDFLSVDDESDFDYFKFTVADPITITATLIPRGTHYHQGPESSQTQPEFDAKFQSNLGIKLIAEDGTTVMQTGDGNGVGGLESIVKDLPAAGTYYLKVFGSTTDKVQLYGLDLVAGNNPVGLAINDVTVTEGANAAVNAVFTVTLATPSAKPVTVDYTTSNGSAHADKDYVPTAGQLTFAPGETSKTISVPVLNDSKFELTEQFFVRLSNSINSSIAIHKGHGTIHDDDVAPGLSITDVSVVEGHTGKLNAAFTVKLSSAIDDPVSVHFATADGSAKADSDYVAKSGTLTFAPGETTQTITVEVVGETLFESDEVFFVILSQSQLATISDPYAEGKIKNDDKIGSVLSINDVTVTEGTGNVVDAVFTVNLSEASGVPVTVKYLTAKSTAVSPEDFTATSGTVTFAPGETSRTITVSVAGDLIDEPTQTFFVKLSSPTNATIVDGIGLGTILDDDDAPVVSIGDVSLTEGSGTTVNAVFTVTLSAPSSSTVTVNYASADGTAIYSADYLAKRGPVLFAAGQTSKTIIIPIKTDKIDEPDEVFFVNLTNSLNATIGHSQGQCTIIDDDATPTVAIKSATVTEGTGTTVKANFTVTLSAASGYPVTVDYATADNSATVTADYAAATGTLTFAPGQTTKVITVLVAGDALDELATETFFVNLSNPANATLAVGKDVGVGAIADNDAAPKLSISNATVTEGTNGAVDLVFTVTLSAASGQAVSVNYATTNGTADSDDYTSANGSVVFNAGETSKTITVSILDDSIAELSETVLINLTNAINALFSKSSAVGYILDND